MKKTSKKLVIFCGRISPYLSRAALFIVFVWFGVLKITGDSVAIPLMEALLLEIAPFLKMSYFILPFAFYEIVIGITFIIPRAEKVAVALLLPHMAMTFLPLILLPEISWQAPFVPTLEGQYIIKNLIIVALAVSFITNFYRKGKI